MQYRQVSGKCLKFLRRKIYRPELFSPMIEKKYLKVYFRLDLGSFVLGLLTSLLLSSWSVDSIFASLDSWALFNGLAVRVRIVLLKRKCLFSVADPSV